VLIKQVVKVQAGWQTPEKFESAGRKKSNRIKSMAAR
jgi:hypothetical protein